jgi:7,8-dihydropterin-6-yl-methyl-4-(beta-D-ribofuranosyl)aminobenzene 5'-phosphate synthase
VAIKIITLIENSPGEHRALKAEHGIAFLIVKDNLRILFDTGQSGAFIENARQLRVDLTALDYVILSHGHYDHSGGFRRLTELTTDFELILGEGFFDEKYGYKNNAYEYLGNNFSESFLSEQGIACRFVGQALTELASGVYVVTGFPRVHADEVINPRFKVLRDGAFVPDCFTDEVLLAVDSPEGLIVLLGCSHPGLKNMLDAVTGLIKRPIHAVLGGTHLVEASIHSLGISIAYLQNSKLKVIGVSHCTGQAAMERLAGSESRYFHNRTGSALVVAE